MRRLVRDIIGASAITGTLVALHTSDAAAQRVLCKDRDEIVEILARKHDETNHAFGLQSDGRVLEIWHAHDGSWTALLTMPNGKSCVVGAGEGWTRMPPRPAGDPT